MSIFVKTKNEQEEKVLLAFLESLHYDYQSDIEDDGNKINNVFINQYNSEIDQADADIESGNFVRHQDVEQFFQQRRKGL